MLLFAVNAGERGAILRFGAVHGRGSSPSATLKNEVLGFLKDRIVPSGVMAVELSITDLEDRIKADAEQKIATVQAEDEALRLWRRLFHQSLYVCAMWKRR